jgi:hypothetical protein
MLQSLDHRQENKYSTKYNNKYNNDPVSPPHSYMYTPGAADDQESWARHLMPRLFWERQQEFQHLLEQSDDQVDGLIDDILLNEQERALNDDLGRERK